MPASLLVSFRPQRRWPINYIKMNKKIKLNQKAVEPVVEDVIKVDHDTEVTVPINVFAAMVASLPKVNFVEAKRSVINALEEASNHDAFLECLKGATDQAEFYDYAEKVKNAYRRFVGLPEHGI